MKDYVTIWTEWMKLLNKDVKSRKQFLDSLHFETQKGFDVIVRIATEELEQQVSDKHLLKKINEELEFSLSVCVLSGYLLFLVSLEIDPKKENLIARTQTNKLGNVWIENYDKDQGRSLLLKIDPILSLFLEKTKQSELNRMIYIFPEVIKFSYEQVGKIETFLSWASHQGFILGILEQELFLANNLTHAR